MYKNEWQSIIAQCDEMIYLGGNDSETHKYVSERLGKETIYTQTTGQTEVRMVLPRKISSRSVVSC